MNTVNTENSHRAQNVYDEKDRERSGRSWKRDREKRNETINWCYADEMDISIMKGNDDYFEMNLFFGRIQPNSDEWMSESMNVWSRMAYEWLRIWIIFKVCSYSIGPIKWMFTFYSTRRQLQLRLRFRFLDFNFFS